MPKKPARVHPLNVDTKASAFKKLSDNAIRPVVIRRIWTPGPFETGLITDPFVVDAMEGWSESAVVVPGPFECDDDVQERVFEAIGEMDGESLTDQEKLFLASVGAALVAQDEQGFIDVRYFESVDAAEVVLEREYPDPPSDDDHVIMDGRGRISYYVTGPIVNQAFTMDFDDVVAHIRLREKKAGAWGDIFHMNERGMIDRVRDS